MANDINKVVLIGNLVRDMELSYGKSGSAIGSIAIASNRSVKRGDKWDNEVSYFDISLFGKSAENLKPYLLKGKKIAVEGSLRQDRWEKDGKKFSKVRIVANSVELLGGNSSGASNGESVPPQVEALAADVGGTVEEFPEDIPF